MTNITLKIVQSTPDDPKLVSFIQGIPSGDIYGNEDNLDPIQLTITEKRSGKRKKQQLMCNVNGVTYKGINFDEYSTNNNSCKYVIGVLNAGDEFMTLSPADHIFTMKPELVTKDVVPRMSTMSAYDRRTSLTEGEND